MTAERPRDRLGRPLPHDAPPDLRAPDVPDISGLDDAAVWQAAQHALESGLPFHAHEICELRWRTCPAQERALWRALAQWGAAETHAARGNAEGARRLAERALEGLDGLSGQGSSVTDVIPLAWVKDRCRSLR